MHKVNPWNVLALSCVVLGVVLLFCSQGCTQPPKMMILVDTDADGTPDRLARDINEDGAPDVDPATGEVILVPDSGIYEVTEKIDAVGPTALTVLGNLLIPVGWPASVLLGIAGVWKGSKVKFGRIIANTVMSIQLARERLQNEGNETAINIVEDALKNQLPETVAAVKKAKKDYAVASVTENL